MDAMRQGVELLERSHHSVCCARPMTLKLKPVPMAFDWEEVRLVLKAMRTKPLDEVKRQFGSFVGLLTESFTRGLRDIEAAAGWPKEVGEIADGCASTFLTKVSAMTKFYVQVNDAALAPLPPTPYSDDEKAFIKRSVRRGRGDVTSRLAEVLLEARQHNDALESLYGDLVDHAYNLDPDVDDEKKLRSRMQKALKQAMGDELDRFRDRSESRAFARRTVKTRLSQIAPATKELLRELCMGEDLRRYRATLLKLIDEPASSGDDVTYALERLYLTMLFHNEALIGRVVFEVLTAACPNLLDLCRQAVARVPPGTQNDATMRELSAAIVRDSRNSSGDPRPEAQAIDEIEGLLVLPKVGPCIRASMSGAEARMGADK